MIERSMHIQVARCSEIRRRDDSRDESGRPKQSGQRKAKGANAMVIGEKYTHRRINYANNLYTLWPSRKEFRYHKIFATATVGAQKCACARARAHVCASSLFFPFKNCCVCARSFCMPPICIVIIFFSLFLSSILSPSPFPSPVLAVLRVVRDAREDV